MAKNKGGLGRGLGTLLASNASTQSNDAVQRVMVNPDKPEKQAVKVTPQNTPEQSKTAHDALFQSQEVYSNKEDNITIKEVKERPAAPAVSQMASVASAAAAPVATPDGTKPAAPVQAAAPVSTLPVRESSPLTSAALAKDKKEDAAKASTKEKSSTKQSEHPAALEVDIDLVEPNPDQPRTNFKKKELEELSDSIRKNGLLQPILVRAIGDTYQIIAGERRWQASKAAGLKKVPIRIKSADDTEAIELALVENVQRSDLNPIEEAYGYKRMMERANMTQSEVAQAVSKGRSTIANALRLLELPEDAQQLLFEEKITAGHARAILSVPTEEGRKKLTEKLLNSELSVRETENLARLMSGKAKPAVKTKKEAAPSSFKMVAKELKDTLGTNVKVRSTNGKNKIEIEFADEGDLQRIFGILRPSSN